jgi:hypothetical protein
MKTATAPWHYTTLRVPAAGSGATYALGINASGLIVGRYFETTLSIQHGFLYNPNGGTYTTIDDTSAFGGPIVSVATGINNAGLIVGYMRMRLRSPAQRR